MFVVSYSDESVSKEYSAHFRPQINPISTKKRTKPTIRHNKTATLLDISYVPSPTDIDIIPLQQVFKQASAISSQAPIVTIQP